MTLQGDFESWGRSVLREVGADRQTVVTTDSGAKEYRRRMNRACTEDHFLCGNVLALGGANPCGAAPIEEHSIDQNISTNIEVRSRPRRLDIGVVRGHTPSVANGERDAGDARGARRVIII